MVAMALHALSEVIFYIVCIQEYLRLVLSLVPRPFSMYMCSTRIGDGKGPWYTRLGLSFVGKFVIFQSVLY